MSISSSHGHVACACQTAVIRLKEKLECYGTDRVIRHTHNMTSDLCSGDVKGQVSTSVSKVTGSESTGACYGGITEDKCLPVEGEQQLHQQLKNAAAQRSESGVREFKDAADQRFMGP
ncbi:hypothetical protein ROHU_012653 [Labeo rohita]|uniref:Uncharacterized protein n=1 Tax=Labeo rohita TaxID=84645 RepID=A0A498LJE9_LABRO|nr:hypothetical protein ROHU_012653 [Labeo rohita]